MIVVLPAETAVTIPVVGLTVAAEVLLLLQLPPLAPVLVNVVVDPVQRNVVPVIVPAFGSGFTVMLYVAVAVPQLVVTV